MLGDALAMCRDVAGRDGRLARAAGRATVKPSRQTVHFWRRVKDRPILAMKKGIGG